MTKTTMPDPAFLPLGDDFPEPHMGPGPVQMIEPAEPVGATARTGKHTPGRLVHVTEGAPRPDIRAESGRAVAVTWMVCASTPKTAAGYQARAEEDRANARRLVACWNALLRFSTEEIEAGTVHLAQKGGA